MLRAMRHRGLIGLIASSQPPAHRLGLLDSLRGAAFLALFALTLAGMLADRGLIAFDPLAPAARVARFAIAAGFFLIAGFSLALASWPRPDWVAIMRRLVLIGAAAVLVSLATLVAAPERFVFFGALHLLAAGGALALAFIRLPFWGPIALALIVLFAPALVASPRLDEPAVWWIGLGSREPASLEYYPLAPWLGFLLLGLGLGRLLQASGGGALERWRGGFRFTAPLRAIGRHTLALYLAQVPAILLGLKLLQAATGLQAGAPLPEAAYLAACRQAAIADGIGPEPAEGYCACNLDSYRREGLWRAIATGNVSAPMRARIEEIARICLALAETR